MPVTSYYPYLVILVLTEVYRSFHSKYLENKNISLFFNMICHLHTTTNIFVSISLETSLICKYFKKIYFYLISSDSCRIMRVRNCQGKYLRQALIFMNYLFGYFSERETLFFYIDTRFTNK